MKHNIIDDLRPYYLKHKSKIHKLLDNPKMKTICDGYFIDRLSFVAMALKFRLPTSEVRQILINASGLIIRNRLEF